ncbi:MAG: hypothetical protein FWG84_06090 [Bacteroidales bacterium]|nr:hypothetical protein [Bacteroidales bacterium]
MNITHIINLLRASFIERRKMLLILTIIAFAAAILESINGLAEISPALPFGFLIVIAGIFFQSSLKRNNSAHFFNLPVTAGEKLLHAIIALVILLVVFHITVIAGTYVGYYLIRPIFNSAENILIVRGMSIWELNILDLEAYLSCAAALSVFLFGSIYFKRKAFIKTLALGVGFLIVIALYNLLLLFIAFGSIDPFAGGEYSWEITSRVNMLHVSFSEGYEYIIFPIITLFFLSLTYLRLKETEV